MQVDCQGLDQCHLCDVSRVARSLGQKRLEALAGRVVHRLQRLPSNGIFGDDCGLRTVWDEYCFDQQQGPSPSLDYAWANLIDPTIVERVSIIDDDEQYLMTLAGGWLLSEFDLPIGICRDVIVRAVRKELVGQALDRMLPRAKGF